MYIFIYYYYKVIFYQDKLARSLKIIISLIYKTLFLLKNMFYLTDIFENIVSIKYIYV